MKKIILGILALVVLGGGGTAAVLAYQYNNQYGLTMAEAVSHVEAVTPQTRVRAVVEMDRLRDRLAETLSGQVTLPEWLPYNLEELLDEALPREIALLAGPNWSDSAYNLTIFANERRGGPFITQLVNDSGAFDQVQWISWDQDLAVLERRGVITARGTVPIPPNTETRVLSHWTHDAPEETLEVQGGHLAEITFDNRNGDSMTVFATMVNAFGGDWENLANNQPMVVNLLKIFPNLYTLRATVDLIDRDRASIVLTVHAHDDARPQLTFLGNAIALPEIKKQLLAQYGLTLEGEIVWDEAEGAAIGDFILSGLDAFIQQRMQGGGAPATPAQPIS